MSSYDPGAIPTTRDLSAFEHRGHLLAEGRKLNFDGFVESPSAALRFIFRHCSLRLGTPHSSRPFRLRRIGAPCISSLCRLPWRLLTKSSTPPSTRPGRMRSTLPCTIPRLPPPCPPPPLARIVHQPPAATADLAVLLSELQTLWGGTLWERLPAATEWATAGRSIRRRRIVAALIVSSEAWRCSGGACKIRGASLSVKEGSGSGCALPHSSPCLRRRPVLPSRKPSVLGCSFCRLRTSSRWDVLKKYASGPSPCGCPVARPSPRSRCGVSCMMRARHRAWQGAPREGQSCPYLPGR